MVLSWCLQATAGKLPQQFCCDTNILTEFDLSLKVHTISIQISKTTKQCHETTDDCLSSHIWAGFDNFSTVVLMQVVYPFQVCQVERLGSTSRHGRLFDSCRVLTYLTLVALVSKEPNFSSVYSNPFSPYLTWLLNSFIKKLSFVIVLIPQFHSCNMGSIMSQPSNSSDWPNPRLQENTSCAVILWSCSSFDICLTRWSFQMPRLLSSLPVFLFSRTADTADIMMVSSFLSWKNYEFYVPVD